eukprot:TRINITY_DN9873_c0_g1_i1.p1 TRINITY_DN9873_c0_g1~~TRINITY_DN9873_c0_g1_i1.p1  ORF type:complete len:236 (-),score=26.59 TRINITY_DN9873_c0_g1_i1:129-836(-)
MEHPSNCMANRFEFLFEDAKQRNQSKEKFKDSIADRECTFHPSINDYAADIKISIKKEGLGNRRVEDDHLFRPKVGRSPKNGHNSLCLPIGEYLYSQGKRKREFLSRLQESEARESRARSSSSYIKDKSKHILEKKKAEVFKELFTLLDKDGDGIIAVKDIELTELPMNVRKMCEGFLVDTNSKSLGESEFIKISEKLYNRLSLPDKNSIINYRKVNKRAASEKHRFRVSLKVIK